MIYSKALIEKQLKGGALDHKKALRSLCKQRRKDFFVDNKVDLDWYASHSKWFHQQIN